MNLCPINHKQTFLAGVFFSESTASIMVTLAFAPSEGCILSPACSEPQEVFVDLIYLRISIYI